MADRSVRIITKQTAVPGRIPTGTTGYEDNFIRQGEMAQNTADKKLFGYDGTSIFEYGSNSFVGLTGGTISGNLKVTGNLSGGTIYSGGTDLYNIFSTTDNNDITRVQPGSNITTGGTGNNPTINLTASPSINGLTLSGTGNASAFSATTLSGGTILSGSTNLYSIFATIPDQNDVTRVQPGSNITTGGTANAPTINLVDSPSVNGLSVSGTGNFTGTLQSGGTNLNNIYIQGSGTSGTIPLWNGTRVQGNSVITQSGTGVTVNGSIYIYGNVDVLGTASTFNTQTIQTADNNITMNLSGSHISAFGGGITVLSGTPNNGPSSWTIDVNGAWSANTAIYTSAITVNGGTITSGSTDLYQIFARPELVVNNVNAGSNLTTGGTAISPIINLTASPSVNNLTFSGTAIGGTVQAGAGTFTSLSATTLSGGTILSGGTNLYSIFATNASITPTYVQPGLNTYTGGTSTNPTVNVSAATLTYLSATTLSGGTITSGSTDLYQIFARPELVVNNVNAGSNLTTGGTAISPIINLTASPSVNNLTISGTGTASAFSSTSISATSYYNDTQQIFGVFRGATAPLNTGNTWVRNTDSELFVYDTNRAKWLSPNENYFGASRDSAASTDLFLRYYDGVPMNTTPLRLPYDITITKIIANGNLSQTWKAFVLTGATVATDVVLTLNLTAQNYSAKTDYNLNISSGSSLYLYCSGTSIDYPTVMVYYKQQG